MALGGFAVYRKVSDNILDRQIAEGTAEMNVKVAARQAGQSVDEFLEYYGVADKGLNGDSTLNELTEQMTLGNFAKYQGQDYESFISDYGLADKGVSEDMAWKDAEKLIPLGTYIGDATQIDSFKEFYGLDASVTADTPWGDVADIVEAKNEELAQATPIPTEDTAQAADDAAAADAQATASHAQPEEGTADTAANADETAADTAAQQ